MQIIKSILARADRGFTLPVKCLLTVGWFIYFLSPLDLLPEFPLIGIGYADDAFLGYALVRVWLSPTLTNETA